MEIKNIGVIGCGLMGSGIAQVSAQAGYDTAVVEASEEALAAGLDRIDRFLAKGIERGKVTAEDKAATLGRIRGTTDLGSLSDRDLVIEAVVEDLELKRKTYSRLDEVIRPDALLAINTSCTRVGNAVWANSPKARENFDSLGMPLLLSQPQIRRMLTSEAKRSSKALVVGRL